MNIESIYSRTVYTFIPCPKILLINTLQYTYANAYTVALYRCTWDGMLLFKKIYKLGLIIFWRYIYQGYFFMFCSSIHILEVLTRKKSAKDKVFQLVKCISVHLAFWRKNKWGKPWNSENRSANVDISKNIKLSNLYIFHINSFVNEIFNFQVILKHAIDKNWPYTIFGLRWTDGEGVIHLLECLKWNLPC